MKTATTSSEKSGGMGRALWSVAIIGAATTLVAAVASGARPAVSVAFGAAIAVSNLWAIGLVVRGLLGPKRGSTPWALLAVAKFTVLIGGLYFLLKSGWVDLLPLLIGYGALPLGIVAGQLGAPHPVHEET